MKIQINHQYAVSFIFMLLCHSKEYELAENADITYCDIVHLGVLLKQDYHILGVCDLYHRDFYQSDILIELEDYEFTYENGDDFDLNFLDYLIDLNFKNPVYLLVKKAITKKQITKFINDYNLEVNNYNNLSIAQRRLFLEASGIFYPTLILNYVLNHFYHLSAVDLKLLKDFKNVNTKIIR